MKKSDVREALLRLEWARKRLLQPYFQKMGLTPGQPRILNKLYDQDGLTQRELADRCGMDVATISRTLDKLEEAGYLNREKHPDCRRSFLVVLTEKGRLKAGEVRAGFQTFDELLWKNFTEDEMKRILTDLDKMFRNLEKEE